MKYRCFGRQLLLLGVFGLGASANAIDISFTDVADKVGLTYVGQTFGQSWGDYDRDGYADLYVSHHGFATTVYKNNNGLSFLDQSALLNADLVGDIHGGAWGDFDNDGDRDLLFIEGASSELNVAPNRLLENDNGTFNDVTAQWNLGYELSRGRMASWFDWNQDGLLDVGLSNWPRSDGQAPTAIFTRTADQFVFDNANLGFATAFSNNFMTLVQVNSQPEPALLVNTVFGFPEAFYDLRQAPFLPLQQALGLPTISATWDFAAQDFDGNLDQELFFARKVDSNEVVLFTDTELRSRMYGISVGELSFTFATAGPIDILVAPDFEVDLEQIKIGSSEVNPDSYQFTLDPASADVTGASIHDENNPFIYIHYDTANSVWNVAVTERLRPNIQIKSTTSISALQTHGFISSTGARTAIKYNQGTQGYTSSPVLFGLTVPYPCPSLAVADFDNDMDVDVYLGCESGAMNRPNRFLENNGSGSFTEVIGAAGAAGTTEGRTDVVTVADYNNDGFMDIFVSNGLGNPPFSSGPNQLFRNSGNSNNWVHIDLTGVTVNRDAVGAWVEVTAGGVTQSRLQSNGTKRFGQDDQRLHFGLGENEVIESILVRWPGGQEQVLGSTQVNQVLSIVQEVIADSDGDSILDNQDNCREISNPLQRDTDGDGFGNRCDPDLNNDNVANFIDLQIVASLFLTSDPDADFDGDGAVNFLDVSIFADFFLLPPGPGALE